MHDKIYYCTKMRVLAWLSDHGYTSFGMVPDRRNADYVVWLFAATPELLQCVEDYYHSDTFINRKCG